MVWVSLAVSLSPKDSAISLSREGVFSDKYPDPFAADLHSRQMGQISKDSHGIVRGGTERIGIISCSTSGRD